ncbi:Coiled-coil domain-containing protein 37 [Fasciolopsis buskii]|uniref:Coiled-coil domain-containing protein 37 n=1 Tax=Fasciolopsis buskii TaxID=27845 RepID=A0A8E0VIX2_9TREM|nr:Coiled-coil domain-containing protein 37 [Fasciolopsis buski]
MAFHVGSSTKAVELGPNSDPSHSACPPNFAGELGRSIKYPFQKPFRRYLEELVHPKIGDDRPTLVKREPPAYLQAEAPKGNPYSSIRFERINELKERDQARKESELERIRSAHDISGKLPIWIRQRHTAAANMRKLIHEENVKEMATYGRLFEPNSLTAQPVGSKLCKISHPSVRSLSHAHSANTRALDEDTAVNETKTVPLNDEIRSIDLETESKNDASHAETDRLSLKTSDERETVKIVKEPYVLHKPNRIDEGVGQFVQDRRRVCLLELAVRTKRGEVKRLDTIMQAENDFLAREEHELLRRHEEHDRYLKSICQRTAEAIRLAEGEARKRNEVCEKIKRARYRLAHLNAECVKLEEEFLRLSTYKDFLHKVAETFREHHTHFKPLTKHTSDSSGPQTVAAIHSTTSNPPEIDLANKESGSEIDLENSQMADSTGGAEQENDGSLIDFFNSPQDLVDILSELESNNLTLIENVQEQEEVCERVRAKAAKLYALLNVERKNVDDHIARERENITEIQENVNSISLARNALSDFVLLERYAKVFYLGDMHQFDTLDHTGLLTSTGSPTSGKSLGAGVRSFGKGTGGSADQSETRPTISNLLSLLQIQIQKVYSAVYGTNEGGARLDTLVMLRRLETTVDELSEMLNAYPRHLVIKAKRTVDERNRVNARRRQKVETQLAYERRLERAIKKAREPPRWRFGRRVLQRSRPPEIRKTVHIGAVTVESEDDKKSLFQ